MNDLSILGPINVFKLKWKPVDFPRKVVGELWNYPDGSRILELSTKCLPADAFQAAAEVARLPRLEGNRDRRRADDQDPHRARVLRERPQVTGAIGVARPSAASTASAASSVLSSAKRSPVKSTPTGTPSTKPGGHARGRQAEEVRGHHAPHQLQRRRRVHEVPTVRERKLGPGGSEHEVGVGEPHRPLAHQRLTRHEHLRVPAEVERRDRVEQRAEERVGVFGHDRRERAATSCGCPRR